MKITDKLERMINDLRIPPQNEAAIPTTEDIVELLEAALNYISYPDKESEKIQELRDDIDDLYDGINRAIDELENVQELSELDGIITDLRML